MKMLEAGIWM